MKENWYKNKSDLNVKYLWWYDTIAILDEYDDTEDGVLPMGELVKISEDKYLEEYLVLDLKNHKKLIMSQLPKGRVHKTFMLCNPTPLQALVTKDAFNSNFEKIENG